VKRGGVVGKRKETDEVVDCSHSNNTYSGGVSTIAMDGKVFGRRIGLTVMAFTDVIVV